jgi:hypothetical protein
MGTTGFDLPQRRAGHGDLEVTLRVLTHRSAGGHLTAVRGILSLPLAAGPDESAQALGRAINRLRLLNAIWRHVRVGNNQMRFKTATAGDGPILASRHGSILASAEGESLRKHRARKTDDTRESFDRPRRLRLRWSTANAWPTIGSRNPRANLSGQAVASQGIVESSRRTSAPIDAPRRSRCRHVRCQIP